MSIHIHRWLHRKGLSRRNIRRNWFGRVFGDWLLDKNYWVPCPKAIAKGWLIGAVSATSPFMGFQIIMALPFALIFRANIPIVLVLILLTNPLTYLPYIAFAYWLGAALLGRDTELAANAGEVDQVATSTTIWEIFHWQNLGETFWTLFLGCTLVGLTVGMGGYFAIRYFWKPSQRIRHFHGVGRGEAAEPASSARHRTPVETADPAPRSPTDSASQL
ncbi:MAG: DUF2062 domain-containing protein [Verrucomicrobiota bacterium]